MMQVAGACLLERERGDVFVGIAVGDRAEQPVAKRVAARQRHSRDVAGADNQVGILEVQRNGGAGALVAFVDDDFSVDLVGGRREEPFRHDVEEHLRLDVILSHQRKRFPHRLNRTPQHEIVGQLDGARGSGCSRRGTSAVR
jgi:hypothetical protein